MDTIQKLFRFLDESPTCYHAAANVLTALKEAGAVELRESEPWKLERGGLYAVERGDSAVIAFRVPEEPFRGFLLAAAHSDSPTFRIRENPAAQHGALRRRHLAGLAGSPSVRSRAGGHPAGEPPAAPPCEY